MIFRISDIIDGKSTRSELVKPEALDMPDVLREEVKVDLVFFKTHDMIHVHFVANGAFHLLCDRSLEEFIKEFKCTYDIYYKVNAEESEDESSAVRPLLISSNKINIFKELRDSILLDIPIKKIHPKFLDESGQVTEFSQSFGDSEPGETTATDPRWDALKKIQSNQNN